MANNRYQFYSDSGHGWLAVPAWELRSMGLLEKITKYSYMKDQIVYLEEDCDAGEFVDSKRRNGHEVIFEEHLINGRANIRDYQSYDPSAFGEVVSLGRAAGCVVERHELTGEKK